MSKITIFLTGGSGFIGRNIIEQLGDKYTILAPRHSELDLTDADAVCTYLQKNPVDIVINAAAIGVKRTDPTVSVAHINLRIFFNLIRAKPFYQRMIMLGSGAEYDKRRPLAQVAESAFGKKMPADEYGFYKYVCAEYAQKVDYITHLRLFGVFGMYEDYATRFISNVICQALFDLPVTMSRHIKFDYLYVNDLCVIIDRCIVDPPAEVCLNLGSGESLDLHTIAEKILAVMEKKLPITIKDAVTWGNEYAPSIAKFKEYWPEFTPTPLDTAIGDLVAYYTKIKPTLSKETFLSA